MPVIPDPQIAQYARNAGFASNELATMVAIALAESGGDTSAIGDTALETQEWGPSVGLWQIRSLNAEKGKGTTRDETANLDPQINANHAKSIRDSQGLGAWSTYSRGTYAMYLNRGNTAVSGLGPGDTTTVGNPFSIPGLAEFKAILSNLSNTAFWLRIGIILGGASILILGLILLISPKMVGVATASVTTVGRRLTYVQK